MIPPEIEKLGEEFVKVYYEALNEGKQKIPYCSMLILGREEVGKTSLFRQLVGKHFMKVMDRTRGIDNNEVETVDTRNVKIDKEQWTEKKVVDVGERFSNELLGEFNEKLPKKAQEEHDGDVMVEAISEADILAELREITPEQVTSTNELPAASKVSDASHAVRVSNPLPKKRRTATSRSHQKQLQVNSTDGIAIEPSGSFGMLSSTQTSRINEIVKSGKTVEKKDPSMILNTLDFAGQKEYRSMHHCFILKRALYLVVFKIPDMLKYIRVPKQASYNPLDDICYWIRSIDAHICSSQAEGGKEKVIERVLLVGTYLGDHSDEDVQEIDDFIHKKLIMSKDDRYINHIHSVGVSCGPAYFIPVENSIDIESRGESYLRESGTKLIQTTILKMSKELTFLDEYYPIKWLKFEERLKQTYDSGASTPIMKIKDVKELAVKSGITSEEQQDLALKFFHESGKIICLSKCIRQVT